MNCTEPCDSGIKHSEEQTPQCVDMNILSTLHNIHYAQLCSNWQYQPVRASGLIQG
jgi:hypothetical protein